MSNSKIGGDVGMTSKQGSVEHGREPLFFYLEPRVFGGKSVRVHLLHAQQRVTNCLPQGIHSNLHLST